MEWAQMMQMPESEWRDVEFKYGGKWMSVDKGDAPAFNAHKEYRFKPRTIRIGDIDVPEPVTIWKYENGTLAIVFDDMESCNIAYAALKPLTQKKE